MNNTSDI